FTSRFLPNRIERFRPADRATRPDSHGIESLNFAMSAQHYEMTATAKVFVVINRKAGGGKDEGFEANLGELFQEQGRDCEVLHIGGGVDLRTRLASANLPD